MGTRDGEKIMTECNEAWRVERNHVIRGGGRIERPGHPAGGSCGASLLFAGLKSGDQRGPRRQEARNRRHERDLQAPNSYPGRSCRSRLHFILTMRFRVSRSFANGVNKAGSNWVPAHVAICAIAASNDIALR